MNDAVLMALKAIGQDSIEEFYSFFLEKQSKTDTSVKHFADWLMFTRILVELSLAVTAYASEKDK